MTDRPVRLRRSEPGRADPPAGTTIGGTVVLEPLRVERGNVSGSSDPANEQSAGQVYVDRAEVKKRDSPPPARPSPFALQK